MKLILLFKWDSFIKYDFLKKNIIIEINNPHIFSLKNLRFFHGGSETVVQTKLNNSSRRNDCF